mmetsp:Transcript_13315/g.27361  ORF Transcript_13315/g.27361 Transcript_13315/m.27361 type:complete len:155 (-) Transcript_13315:94-558(-)
MHSIGCHCCVGIYIYAVPALCGNAAWYNDNDGAMQCRAVLCCARSNNNNNNNNPDGASFRIVGLRLYWVDRPDNLVIVIAIAIANAAQGRSQDRCEGQGAVEIRWTDLLRNTAAEQGNQNPLLRQNSQGQRQDTGQGQRLLVNSNSGNGRGRIN